MSDIPSPPTSAELITYADNIVMISSHQKPAIIVQQIQSYLNQLES